MKITSLNGLKAFLASVPEGTTVDILGQDLEAGNFETATFEVPGQGIINLTYTGPVERGYVSPFEMAEIGSDGPDL